MRNLFLLTVILFLLINCIGCRKRTSKDISYEMFKFYNLHNGDAKFYRDYIITNVNSILTIFNLEGNKVAEFPQIKVNWLDCIDDEGVIIYGNFNKETGKCVLDNNLGLVKNSIIMKSENLAIDQTILQIRGGGYYITRTEILGNVNNSEPDGKNGVYTVKLYSSLNLEDWNFVGDILSCNKNIEDVKLNYWDNKFYLTYEKESYDKGKSSINLVISKDSKGIEWGNAIQLVEENADNEPGHFRRIEQGYELYFSSDIENQGGSYDLALCYMRRYDEDFNVVEERRIETSGDPGVLLYDMVEKNNLLYLCYAQNYSTNCNLVVSKTAYR